MFLVGSQSCIAVMILTWMVNVQSLPIRRIARGSKSSSTVKAIDDPIVIMSPIIHERLINTKKDSLSLYTLWDESSELAKESLLKTKYQSWEQKVCRGKVFNVNGARDSYTSNKKDHITYSQLTNYYNELVIQLRLAVHNLNGTIAMEVKEKYLNRELKRQQKIIKLLNETILPALNATLNISTSNTSTSNTNCSATTALVNRITSLYANCAAVQTSNTILAQTSRALFNKLYHLNTAPVIDDNDDGTTVDIHNSSKDWCIIIN